MPIKPQNLYRQISRFVPIAAWLPDYPRDLLRNDLISGVTVWGVMVPVAMAYAQMAGAPPELGASADLDIASLDMLKNLVAELDEMGIDVLLAQVRGSGRDRLRQASLMAEIGEDRVYLSVVAAVHNFEQRAASAAKAAWRGWGSSPTSCPSRFWSAISSARR